MCGKDPTPHQPAATPPERDPGAGSWTVTVTVTGWGRGRTGQGLWETRDGMGGKRRRGEDPGQSTISQSVPS